MKNKRRLLFLGLFILTVMIIVGLTMRRHRQVEFKTAKATRKDLTKTISASGEIKSETKLDLKFQASGKLAWIGVKEGDSVKKWQAIASLDKKELEKNLKKELLDYMNQRWDFEGDRDTYDITTSDLDRYTLSDPVKRLLQKAQFDLDRDVVDVEITQLAVELATIISPIDGIVTEIDVPVAGVNVTPATAVFTVADPGNVYFQATVDEVDIAEIGEGQKSTLTLDAYPQEPITTAINSIGFQAQSTSGGGTAFPIKVGLPENENLKFKLGMNGDLEIVIESKENVLTVPQTAIIKNKDKRVVFVIQGTRAKKKEVKLGLETDTVIEIIEGIEEGEEVIIEKISTIKDGQKIR